MIVADMKEAGFPDPHMTKDAEGEAVEHDFEPRTATPFGDRGGVVIEPWLTDQWYVDAETLAQPPMQAVRDGRIEIVPKSWGETFFNWMENIQPWCVGRRIVVGPQNTGLVLAVQMVHNIRRCTDLHPIALAWRKTADKIR